MPFDKFRTFTRTGFAIFQTAFPFQYRPAIVIVLRKFTEDGGEIDLLFERGGSVEMAIEIKRSTAPTLSRGFHSACDVLKPKHKYLVHAGTEVWPHSKDVTAITLLELMSKLVKA